MEATPREPLLGRSPEALSHNTPPRREIGRPLPQAPVSSMPNGALVIGYGNELREDDGLGPFVAARISALRLPQVRTMSVHQLTPELAEELSTASYAIFVDACVGPREQRLALQRIVPGCNAWSMTHVFEPRWLLDMALALYGHAPESWSVEVLGERFGYGVGLTESARQHAGEAVMAIRNVLARAEQPRAAR